VATGICTERPILTVLDDLEAAGIRGLEFGTPTHHFVPWEPAQVDAVMRRLRGSSLMPVSMHAPFGGRLDLSDADPHRLHDTLQTLLATAEALAHLGGQVLVTHATDVPRNGEDVMARLDRAARALRVLMQGCQQWGIALAIESPLPHLIGGHPDEFAWLLNQLGPDARVCLDTGHTHLGGHWRRFVEIAGSRLTHVHAHDNHGQFDDHLPPGDGQIDWREIASTLEQANYRGWIMLELQCPAEPLAGYVSRAWDQAHGLLNDGNGREPRS